jgi:hypothetical protein
LPLTRIGSTPSQDSLSGALIVDQAVANALKEKKELEKRLAQIEEFLRLYDEFAGGAEGGSEPKVSVDNSAQTTQTPTKVVRAERVVPKARIVARRRVAPKRPADVADAAAGIIKQLGRPASRGELATLLVRLGKTIPGADQESRARYVGTIMWRNRDRFENIEGRGYWLRGVPLSEGAKEIQAALDILREQNAS